MNVAKLPNKIYPRMKFNSNYYYNLIGGNEFLSSKVNNRCSKIHSVFNSTMKVNVAYFSLGLPGMRPDDWKYTTYEDPNHKIPKRFKK